MSLQLAAKHLEAHGRGDDSHLVHMTTGELGALQKLANAHGGSLTVNPHTGLPEAGFLSSLLPTVAGAALGAMTGIDPMLIAGGVGLADAAVTGSLGQGLMAGLGAWSGAGFGNALSTAGQQSLLQTGGNTADAAFQQAQQAAAQQAAPAAITDATGQAIAPNMAATNIAPTGSSFTNAAQSIVTPQQFPNLSSDQLANIQNQIASAAGDQTTINNVIRAAGQANASLASNAQGLGAVWSGISNPAGTGVGQSLGNAWNFAKANPWSTFGVVSPILGAAMKAIQPGIPSATTSQNTNPMGLKINPQWSGPTVPASPQPYYHAQYPNYVQNPYNPIAAAGGGLMDVKTYADGEEVSDSTKIKKIIDAEQEMQKGLEMISPSKHEMSNYHAAFHTDPGTVAYGEEKYKAADPYQRAVGMMNDLRTAAFVPGKTSMSSAGALGAIPTDPALVSQQQIAQQAQQPAAAKEGGLMNMSMGGIGTLGSYSDGGRLLKGPGDGVSDSIPASIGHHQPARLATGEFVVPSRIVSELGNGSTDAGAKRLYAMMDRVQNARKKTMGKDKFAADTKAYKYLPA